MGNVHIRRLTKEDINSFFDLRLESLKNAPLSFLWSYEEEELRGPAFYERILIESGDDNVIFGAFIKDELVGIAGIYQEKPTRIRHKGIIWAMYTKPNYRKQYIAKTLLEKIIEHAKNNMKCLVVSLSVGANNLPAIKLYESLGFIIWGTEPKSTLIDGNLYDEHYMMLVNSIIKL